MKSLQPRCPAPPATFSRVRVKKGPQNPISVVNGKAAAGGINQPMTDPSATITRCPQAGTPEPGCPPEAGAGTTVARTFAMRATVPPRGTRPAVGPPQGPPPPRRAGTGPYRRVGWAPGAGCQARPHAGRLDGTGGVEGGCLRSRAAGQPAPRPAAGPAATAPGNGGAAPPVTARDPAPCPAGLPLRQGRAARQHPPRRTGRPCGLSSSPVSPQQPPAGAGRRRPGGGRT